MTNQVSRNKGVFFGILFVILIAVIVYLNQRIVANLDLEQGPGVAARNGSAQDGPDAQQQGLNGSSTTSLPAQRGGDSPEADLDVSTLPDEQKIIREAPLEDVILVQ